MFEIIDQSSLQCRASELSAAVPATDCACAGASALVALAPSQPWTADRALMLPSRLHCEALSDSHYALFDPDGSGGVVVVNTQTYDLLQTFINGKTSREAAEGSDAASIQQAAQRLADLGMLLPIDKKPIAAAPESQALSVWLHVTNQCNMRCTYCYIQKTSQDMQEATARGAVEAVVRSALQHGYRQVKFKYAGGEPTLNMKRVLALHDYAEDACAKVGLAFGATLLSNGSLFSARMIQDLKQRKMDVMVSLDGLGHDHDVQRPLRSGKPSFPIVRKCIQRLLDAGIRPHISITLTALNSEGAAQVAAFALKQQCTFALNLYRSSPSVVDSVVDSMVDKEALHLEQTSVIAAFKVIFDLLEANVPPWSVLGAVLDRGNLLAPHDHAACGVGRDYMVIDHNGRVAKCQMAIGEAITDIADPDPLHTIRLSPVGVRNVPAADKEGCRTCAWQRWCGGGCPLVTYEANSRYDVKSPYCDVYRAIYPMAIRAEGMRLLAYGAPLLVN